MNRRKFLELFASSGAGAALGNWTNHESVNNSVSRKRKFKMEFNPTNTGINAGQEEAIEMAAQFGFEAVYAYSGYLAEISQNKRDELVNRMFELGLVWGHTRLPIDFRKGEETFRNDLEELPHVAEGLERAGVTRMSTWIMSNNFNLHYMQNFRRHATRLREVASILKDHGIRLGLEYVGPKTVWTANRFPFMHTMAETKELIAAIGQPNVGFHLDSAHWYTAGETKEDLLSLSNKNVVSCDINDVLAGVKRENLPDTKRELPMATGVIDIAEFLEALVQIDFSGPIQAEPFNKELNQMEDTKAAQKTAEAMKKAFSMIRT